ncbi:hypothetical protein V7S43_009093 [Phytophthora oleae]|uniref:FYVE-type domain-containing protein n=1 Tax=Phytophthora oleae TaxID=2107226 RepID=A0ABD3FIH3_9STRA
MVNCKGVSSTPKSPVNQQICRYCRTRMCEECYLAATSRNSKLQPELARHQHVCLACTRLHPEAKELRSPPRERRPSRLPRLNSAPISGGPRIDSLSNMAREHSTWARSDKPEDQAEAKPKKSTEDRRRRRHTSAVAPTSRSVDFSCPSRPSRARQLLKANATELQAARRRQNATELQTSRRHEVKVPTSYSCDFTSIRDPTSTQKDLELTMTDLHRVPKAQSCDLTGSKPIFDMSDEPTDLELSTVDLRLPKYKANLPTTTKRGRRVSAADPINSALTPISIEHLAAIDAKLSSVELELKRYDVSPKQEKPPKAPSSVSSVESSNSSKRRKNSEAIDFHLSTVDLRPRPRRHTSTETFNQKPKRLNRKPVEEVEGKFPVFQQKKKAEPLDFHLSTFDLKPRRHTTKSNQGQGEDGNESRKKEEKKMKAVSTATPEQTTPMYSKDELCDLAYLDNFRSYTV